MVQKQEAKPKKFDFKQIGMSKFVILLMAGLLLIIVSCPNLFQAKKSTTKTTQQTSLGSSSTSKTITTEQYINVLEERLAQSLSTVSGIGQVNVMITLKSSKQLVVLKDEPYTQESSKEEDGNGGTRDSSSLDQKDTTVLVDSKSGSGEPFIIQEIEPQVEGIVVIAQGGDNAKIITDIMEVVAVLFDVPVHKVKVLKMN